MAFLWGRPLSEVDVTGREFNQALAYLQLHPPEQPAIDRTASILAQIANWSGRAKKWLSADDFLTKTEKPQTAEEQKAFLKGL